MYTGQITGPGLLLRGERAVQITTGSGHLLHLIQTLLMKSKPLFRGYRLTAEHQLAM